VAICRLIWDVRWRLLSFATIFVAPMTTTPWPRYVEFAHALQWLRRGCLCLLCSVGAVLPTQAGEARQGDAARLFLSYCSVCHGEKGDGRSRAQNSLNPPPRDFTNTPSERLPRSQMIEAVTNGRAGTAMAAWKTQLQPQQIEAVVDYVRTTFMPAAVATQSSRGRQVFGKNCSVCHGEKGDGRSRAQNSLNPPPRDFTAAAARAELSAQRMFTSVTYGRADTAMAGFQSRLSPEDIRAVVAYIRADIMGLGSAPESLASDSAKRVAAVPGATAPPVKSVAVNMAAPMPMGLKGDPEKGGSFYLGNCATCHGKSGDGRGPRAYFINPKPRNFLHSASRQEFNRAKLFEMISNGERGTEMPAWKQVLSPQEIANVAEFVFQRFILGDAVASKAAP
jgi:mono/diheme cytochrome c family protein